MTIAERNGTAAKVEIPDFPVVNFTVRIVGRTPLIANRFGEAAITKLEGSQQKRAAHKLDPRDPDQEFAQGRYRLSDGRDASFEKAAGPVLAAIDEVLEEAS